jgi:hypothetical protein
MKYWVPAVKKTRHSRTPYSNQSPADRSAAKHELSSELTESSAARYMP